MKEFPLTINVPAIDVLFKNAGEFPDKVNELPPNVIEFPILTVSYIPPILIVLRVLNPRFAISPILIVLFCIIELPILILPNPSPSYILDNK